MFSITRENKKIPLLIALILAFIACLIVMLPQSLEFIIQKVQIVIHRQLRKPEKWIGVLSSCSRVAIYFIFVIAFLNFTVLGLKIAEQAKNIFRNFIAELKQKETIFSITTIFIFLVFVFYRVLNSDYLYQDDVFRHVSGDRSWIGFSRYISEFFSMLIHTGRKISDIAPLAQIFAILFMTLELSLVSYIIADKISLPLMFASSLIFINPLFSQCISYRYDAPYMVLSIIFPTIPFLFCKRENYESWTFALVSFFFLILCNMTYQAGASVFIVLAINEAYKRFQNKTEVKNFILTAILSFAASLLFFKFALMVPMDRDGYVSSAISISSAGKNIAIYLKLVFALFGGKWTKFFLLIIFVLSFIIQTKNSMQKKPISILLTFIMFTLSLLLSFGAYIIFERPLFSPRAFIGFDFFVGLCCANIYLCAKKLHVLAPIFCLVFGCVVFYYAYGNALRDQRIYQDFRTEILLSDLNKFADNSSKKNITISGEIGHSQGFASAAKTFPIIKYIIAPLPAGNATWNDEILNFYNFNCDDANFSTNHNFPLLLSTNYHDIYGSDNNFYIVLK